jgi:indoleamine 2,3-dioxygenase
MMASTVRNPILHDLADYQVDSVRGFLPAQDPLPRLPMGFEPWERIASRMPMLLTTHRMRRTLDQLPILALRDLEDPMHMERAMLLLSMFATAYVWEREHPATTIPRSIALPLWQIADRLGRPPITAYPGLILYNWQRLDPSGPLDLENLAVLQSFVGESDEHWFYIITIAIEAAAAPAINALIRAQQAVEMGSVAHVARSLETIAAGVDEMYAILCRLPERCDPAIFYHRLRPFLAGWPEAGVIYDGACQTPQYFVGGSAAQSPLLPSLDAGLGLQHHSATASFLRAMRAYMMPAHRQFIETLESESAVRPFVLDYQLSHPALCDIYNACIVALDRFRKKHLEIVVRYLAHQAPEEQAAQGTGGTHAVRFLSQVNKETREGLIV